VIGNQRLAEKLATLSPHEREEAVKLLGELDRRKKTRKFYTMYPDEGPYRRELYPKHMELMAETKTWHELCLRGANRCGKTVAGSYMTTVFATGLYPPWWQGRRFDKPTSIWAAGDTSKTVRDIIQVELLGKHDARGTGMIPGDAIVRCTPKAGVPDAVDTIYVKHYDKFGDQDGVSAISLKSYDQGRESFQGTAQDVIWLDEECPMNIYMECLTRTMTTQGLVFLTFTPLMGLTDVVMLFTDDDNINQMM
jgi:phage terminase large subunit-like protein